MSAENPLQSVPVAPVEESAETPKAPSAEEYKEVETQIAAKREQLTKAPIDQLAGLVSEIEALENKKSEGFDAAYNEAHAENDRMDAEKAAAEKAAQKQAERDAEKAQQEAKNAERVAKIDEQIAAERAQLNGASPEQLKEIVAKLTALEAQKSAPQDAGQDQENAEEKKDDAQQEKGPEKAKSLDEMTIEELQASRQEIGSKVEALRDAFMNGPAYAARKEFESQLKTELDDEWRKLDDADKNAHKYSTAALTSMELGADPKYGLTDRLARYANSAGEGGGLTESDIASINYYKEKGVITDGMLYRAKEIDSEYRAAAKEWEETNTKLSGIDDTIQNKKNKG